MKEYVFAEFLFTSDEYTSELHKLISLGDDFVFLNVEYEFEDSTDGTVERYMRLSAKINSGVATIIKLTKPDLAGKMRVSYISDDLKDKYRK